MAKDGMKWLCVQVLRRLKGKEPTGDMIKIQEARGPFHRTEVEAIQRWLNAAERRDHPNPTEVASVWEIIPLDPTPPKARRAMVRGRY